MGGEKFSLMQLPIGITGLGDVRNGIPSETVDIRAFRVSLYHAAREVGARVLSPPDDFAEYPANYIHALLMHKESRVRVLLNIYHPYLAFADGERRLDDEQVFVAHPDLEAAFNLSNSYKTVDAEMLNSVATDELVSLLRKAERDQYQYWSPCRVGEVVFNSWD